MKGDPYTILEISHGANNQEIKKAYKKLARKWHPDKNPKNPKKAEKKFKEISEAYQQLINPKKEDSYFMNPFDLFNQLNPFTFGMTNFGKTNFFENFNDTCYSRSESISTTILNGKAVTKRIITENGKTTEIITENGKILKRLTY